MKIARFIFNPIQENTYVIYDETGECIVIDAGNYTESENGALSKFIEENSLKPVMAVNTHGHTDHMIGVNYVKDKYGVPFAMNSADISVHHRIYGMEVNPVPHIDVDLAHENTIRFGSNELEVISTPGHSPGGVSLYSRENRVVFTGDTLFKGSIGRTEFEEGDYSEEMRSILGRLIPLGGEVEVYPGHGWKTTIAAELESNPFITEVIEGEVNF